MTKPEVKAFLQKYELDAEQIDMTQELGHMLEAMSIGLLPDQEADRLAKLNGSLPLAMLPTFIGVENKVPFEKPCIVLDAGGTNFRVAVLTMHANKQPDIEHFAVYPMPGSEAELSKVEFYDKIVSFIEPVINLSDDIGFCFSYPAEIMPNRDGRVLSFTKQVRAPEVVGGLIGEDLKAALKRRNLPSDKNICILNDTVATLLGGRASMSEELYDSFVGFIWGTGVNAAYVEKCQEISKIHAQLSSEQLGERMIINTESGYHRPLLSSEIDMEMDEGTVDPGRSLLEKRVSGRYLGLLCLYVIRKAMQDGLFSNFFITNFSGINQLTTKDLDAYMRQPFGQSVLSKSCANDIDRQTLYYIIDNLFERASRYVVTLIAAILVKSGLGKNPLKPTVVTMDGSTYYNSLLLPNKVNYYVKQFINSELNLNIRFNKTENGNLVGAAIAALTNRKA
ncbi:hexokinase family protein [Amygdalobacter nucleatus]|uniref:hypothetical protein n=1 Tax=Amygdalobacter nucleatus TaxID=3029274 RepID=UPI0027A48012|nr:hypothetical protein [Amygdalobacter nucleatus]WEG37496.1 hypothetical protein PYS63_03415 [Amygdalobacter nucleatus]